jgi:hypothetical protein
MQVDQALVFSDNFEIDASDESAWLDLGKGTTPFSLFGSGHALAVVITAKTAVTSGGTPPETYQFQLEMADTNTGTNAEILASTHVISGAAIDAGDTIVLAIPPKDLYRRWYRLKTVIAGDAPGGFVSARLDYLERVQFNPKFASEVGN